jgi:hypothetical protein
MIKTNVVSVWSFKIVFHCKSFTPIFNLRHVFVSNLHWEIANDLHSHVVM